MRLSSDCMSAFHEHLKTTGSSLPIGFSSLVLQSAAWPLAQAQCGFSVPEELVPLITKVGEDGCGEGGLAAWHPVSFPRDRLGMHAWSVGQFDACTYMHTGRASKRLSRHIIH